MDRYPDGTRKAFGGFDPYRSPEDLWDRTNHFIDAFCWHVGGFSSSALKKPPQTETQAELNGEKWIDPDAVAAVRTFLIPLCRYVLLMSDNLIVSQLFRNDEKDVAYEILKSAGHISSKAGILDEFLNKNSYLDKVYIDNQTIYQRLSKYIAVTELSEELEPRDNREIEIRLEELLTGDNHKLQSIFEGQLSREALAKALKAAMETKGSSVRNTAALSGNTPAVVQRTKSGKSSIDKATEILDSLGYEVRIEVVPKDLS